MKQLSIREAASDLGVSTSTVWKAIQLGKIRPVFRIGRIYRIPEATWAEYKRGLVFEATPTNPAFNGGISDPKLIERTRPQ